MSMAYLDQILPVSEHGGGNTKGEYICGPGLLKTLPTDVASPIQKLWRENQANKPIC
jgi:hypothetical protein